jgi:predicted transcriptional regulator of viral defense system
MVEELRKKIVGEEFDYQALLDVLRGYERPRDKITDLLRQGAIIRVKKGIYVFGERYRRRPYSRELLANMVYGPSYVSLDYALHYYGMIPERVEAVTSVTCNRRRRFTTPLGLFIYRGIAMSAYQIGIDQVVIDGGRSFLIATKEKALADKIHDDRGTAIRTQEEMRTYLLDSLRIDDEELAILDPEKISLIAERYKSRKIRLLSGLIRRLVGRRSSHE